MDGTPPALESKAAAVGAPGRRFELGFHDVMRVAPVHHVDVQANAAENASDSQMCLVSVVS